MDTKFDDKLFDDSTTYDDSLFEDVPSEISKTESGLRGAAQGLSFSLADEIAGAAEAAGSATMGSDKLADLMENYRKYRDESRGNFKAAEEANPATYMTGEIGAGIGAGLLTGGAGAVANLGKVGLQQGVKELAKVGLKQGAANAFGASEGDLTQGEVGQVAKDTAIGAGVGAAAGAILPSAVKGAGKVAGSVSEFISDKAPEFIKKGATSFNLAKKGIDVVGTKAQETLDTQASTAANDIIGAFKKQYEQGSKAVGSALKSAPKTDFSAQMTKIEDTLKNSKMLPDDLAKIQSELDMYKQISTTETIEPGLDKALKSMQDLIEKKSAEAKMLGQQVSFPSSNKTDNFINTLQKSINEAGEEQASVLQVGIPEDKIITNSVESFRNMDLQELNNVKKELASFVSGNKNINSQSKSILNNIKKELDAAIEGSMNPQSANLYKTGNEQMSNVYNAGDLLGVLSPEKRFEKDLDIKLANKLLSDSKLNKGTLDRALDYGSEIAPELKESIKDFPVRQQLLNNVAGEGSMLGGMINPKGMAIRAGEQLGKVSGSNIVKTAKDFTKRMVTLPDEKLLNIANKLSQNEGSKSLGDTLTKALQDSSKRDRLLWSLSQQPAFREAVNRTEQNEQEFEN